MKNLQGLKIAMGQIDIVAGDPQLNTERIIAEIEEAKRRDVDIIVFPEMAVPGYLLGDLFEDDAFIAEIQKCNKKIVQATKDSYRFDSNLVVIFGTIVSDKAKCGEDGRIRKYNATILAQDGERLWNKAGMDFTVKTLHPDYRMFDDNRHFYSMRKLAEEKGVSVAEILQPFKVHFDFADVSHTLGIMTCEDMWDGDYFLSPGRMLKDAGAELIINLSCSPWSWKKNAKRDQVVRDLIAEISLPFVYVNNVGCQNNGKNFITFDGGTTIYGGNGDIIYLAEPFDDCVVDFVFTETHEALSRTEQSDVKQLYDAIKVATGGYLRTVPDSAKQKIVIGVSGGIDSANSVALFADILGSERVIGINMPYKNFNAQETKDDARILCDNLGVEYRVVPIDAMVDAQAAAVGIKEGTSQHKSIQARMRMETLAAIASDVNGLFTCNANWTEIAFGYGTIGGDLRGYFAPWMNCLKSDMYKLADFMNQEVFGREVIPASVIEREPMDELVKDGSRGDPFDYGHIGHNGYHDQMVRAIVAFRRNPEWFLEQYQNGTLEKELQLESGHISKLFATGQDFIEDLERCWKLFVGQVFKRVQSVPGALVDKRSFGWDFRESILPVVFTARYKELKEEILS